MKRLFTVPLLFLCAAAVSFAQDLIVKRDAGEIEAKVTTVSPDKVMYKKWDNIDGPTYEMSKSDILFIRYQNGSKDVFDDVRPVQKQGKYVPDKKVRFQAYTYLGADFNSWMGGPTLDVSLGARISDYFYIGFETGFHTLIGSGYGYISGFLTSISFSYTMTAGYVPLGLNMKGYIPVSEKFKPYLNCTLGGAVGCIDMSGAGFYCNVGLGFDYRRFSFGIGYMNLASGLNNGYVKVGIRLGK